MLVVAWPIRDHELVSRIEAVNETKPKELYDESLICGVLPDCFRISHKAVISGAKLVLKPIVFVLHAMIDSTVTDGPEWALRAAQNLGPYLMLRLAFMAAFLYALKRYAQNWWLVGITLNVVLLWWSGAPIRGATWVYQHLLSTIGLSETYKDLLSWHVSRNSTIFVLEYDLLALLAVLTIPLGLTQNTVRNSGKSQMLVGLVLGVTFENLAIVYLIALIWGRWRSSRSLPVRDSFFVALGWCIPIFSIIVYSRSVNSAVFPLICPDDGSACLSIPELGRAMNTEYRTLIIRLAIGFLGLPLLLGMCVGWLAFRLGLRMRWSADLRVYANGTVIGLVFSYFVGYFGSALPTEFGRQSLAAQILLILIGMSLATDLSVRMSARSSGNSVGPTTQAP